MLSEFALIRQYFLPLSTPSEAVRLGIGDDGALFAPAEGEELVFSKDLLVSGRHFFADADPFDLGYKALAVNLSDLAAMGAAPRAFLLGLALPKADPAWLDAFARGLGSLSCESHCPLIGGDTTRGPLTISITVIGSVPSGQALTRSAARAGDDLWVSGTLGDARLALLALQGRHPLSPPQLAEAAARLHRPSPRLALGQALRGLAHAALDLSDGLCGDLQHLLDASGVGATLDIDLLPFGPILRSLPPAQQREIALVGGDDYELCFTAAPMARHAIQAAGAAHATAVTRIGRIEARPGLILREANGQTCAAQYTSFDHFRPD